MTAAWEAGCRVFDAASGGIGGCPFAPGATGNVAMEDVVWLFTRMGVETGTDWTKLLAAADLAASVPGCDAGRRDAAGAGGAARGLTSPARQPRPQPVASAGRHVAGRRRRPRRMADLDPAAGTAARRQCRSGRRAHSVPLARRPKPPGARKASTAPAWCRTERRVDTAAAARGTAPVGVAELYARAAA